MLRLNDCVVLSAAILFSGDQAALAQPPTLPGTEEADIELVAHTPEKLAQAV